MKKNVNAWRLVAVALILYLLAVPLCGTASSESEPARRSANRPAAGYGVQPHLPQNQMEGTHGYYQLLTRPGDTQILYLELHNHLPHPIRVQVQVNDAYSNQNGLIAYNVHQPSAPDPEIPTLQSVMRLCDEMIPVGPQERVLGLQDDVLTIAGGTSVPLPFQITMPQQPVEGQLLGGIQTTRLEDEADPDEDPQADVATNSFAIVNRFSYIIAVQIQQQADPQIAPHFELLSATPSDLAGRDALTVNVSNPNPLVVLGGTLKIDVLDAPDGEVLFTHTSENVRMAPHSVMPYTVRLPDELSLSPGTYPVQVTWTYDAQLWPMRADLKIAPPGP